MGTVCDLASLGTVICILDSKLDSFSLVDPRQRP